MFSRRRILCAFILLPLLLGCPADASDALDRYDARLQEIARSYHQQFSQIRKNQRRMGSDKANIRSAEKQIQQLAMNRNKAIAAARLILQEDHRQTEAAPPAKVSRDQREREQWAAQQRVVEEEQKLFWTKVARNEPEDAKLWAAKIQTTQEEQTAFWAGVTLNEPRDAKLWAAQIQVVEDGQTEFWAQLFEPPKTISNDRPATTASRSDAQLAEQEKPSTAQPTPQSAGSTPDRSVDR